MTKESKLVNALNSVAKLLGPDYKVDYGKKEVRFRGDSLFGQNIVSAIYVLRGYKVFRDGVRD